MHLQHASRPGIVSAGERQLLVQARVCPLLKIGWSAPVDLGSAPEVRADTLAVPSQSKAASGWEGKMHNQHAGFSGVLAEQRMTERQQQAAHQRLVASARPPRRRRQKATRRWWQLVLRPVSA
jgi:hypothetical protein